MSECDNWEKRKKMLEENGWSCVDYQWKNGGLKVSTCVIEAMSDNTFTYFIDNCTAETDTINHPSYYTDGKIEVSDFIADKNLNFFRGNVVKYVARAGKKNAETEVEDLQKARWYIDREIERWEVNNDGNE